jgi:hypothetical protein
MKFLSAIFQNISERFKAAKEEFTSRKKWEENSFVAPLKASQKEISIAGYLFNEEVAYSLYEGLNYWEKSEQGVTIYNKVQGDKSENVFRPDSLVSNEYYRMGSQKYLIKIFPTRYRGEL